MEVQLLVAVHGGRAWASRASPSSSSEHALRDASHQEAGKPAATVRVHDDQVDPLARGHVKDRVRGGPCGFTSARTRIPASRSGAAIPSRYRRASFSAPASHFVSGTSAASDDGVGEVDGRSRRISLRSPRATPPRVGDRQFREVRAVQWYKYLLVHGAALLSSSTDTPQDADPPVACPRGVRDPSRPVPAGQVPGGPFAKRPVRHPRGDGPVGGTRSPKGRILRRPSSADGGVRRGRGVRLASRPFRSSRGRGIPTSPSCASRTTPTPSPSVRGKRMLAGYLRMLHPETAEVSRPRASRCSRDSTSPPAGRCGAHAEYVELSSARAGDGGDREVVSALSWKVRGEADPDRLRDRCGRGRDCPGCGRSWWTRDRAGWDLDRAGGEADGCNCPATISAESGSRCAPRAAGHPIVGTAVRRRTFSGSGRC